MLVAVVLFSVAVFASTLWGIYRAWKWIRLESPPLFKDISTAAVLYLLVISGLWYEEQTHPNGRNTVFWVLTVCVVTLHLCDVLSRHLKKTQWKNQFIFVTGILAVLVLIKVL
jgi:uncharacterized membrane protein